MSQTLTSPRGINVSTDGQTMTICVPLTLRRIGGRKRVVSVRTVLAFWLILDDEREKNFRGCIRQRPHERLQAVLMQARSPKIHIDLAARAEGPGRQTLAE